MSERTQTTDHKRNAKRAHRYAMRRSHSRLCVSLRTVCLRGRIGNAQQKTWLHGARKNLQERELRRLFTTVHCEWYTFTPTPTTPYDLTPRSVMCKACFIFTHTHTRHVDRSRFPSRLTASNPTYPSRLTDLISPHDYKLSLDASHQSRRDLLRFPFPIPTH